MSVDHILAFFEIRRPNLEILPRAQNFIEPSLLHSLEWIDFVDLKKCSDCGYKIRLS